MLPRLPLFLLLLLLCAPAMAQRKDDKNKNADKGANNAPAVEAVEVRVVRGQSVVINLKAFSGANKDVKFLIRKEEMPKLGRFKEAAPVPTSKTEATITYISDPKSKGNKDSFQYSGQVSGSSVGDPRTVTIHITDPVVKLDFMETLDAKRLMLGQPNERTFLLRNGGTAPWSAKVAPPRGWRWIEPADGEFDLGPGREINARISCLAQRVGPMEEVIEFAPGKKMTFVATVIPPFTLLSSSVAMDWQKGARSRAGHVEISNLDNTKSLTVKLSGPPWLKTEPEVTLAADQKVPLALASSTELGKSVSGKLTVSAGTYSAGVDVTAPAAPAVFSVRKGLDADLGFHFGKLSAIDLQTSKRPFTVTNDGGTAGTLKIEPLQFFRLETPPPAEGILLQPGASADFVLLPPERIAGTPVTELTLTGGDDVVKVPCSAFIDPKDLPKDLGTEAGRYIEEKGRKNLPRPVTMEDRIKGVMYSGPGLTPQVDNEDKSVPRIDVVYIVEDTGTEVTFGWDLPPGGPWKFQLHRATIQRLKSRDDPTKVGGYAKVFEPCGDEIIYTVEGNRATAKVSGLHPHTPFTFRIRTIAPEGKVSPIGGMISYRPWPPDPSHWQLYRHWYFITGALLILLGWWGVKKWKEPISASA